MSNYFIHFGCWNNGRCPSDSDFTKVSEQINSLSEKPEFISICGDNYYPTKVKDKTDKNNKKKFLNNEDLESGFNCLPKDIPIYMTFGNHDFETNLFTDVDIQESDCTITNSELAMKTRFPNIKLELFQFVLFKENTLLLFLDTTIYDEDDIGEYIGCYSKVKPELDTIDAVKNAQLEFVRTTIDTVGSNVKNIFIIGHHPIAQYKYKKEKVKYLVLPEFANMIYDNIYSILKDKGFPHIKYYYLCADLHQYQTGTIVIRDEMNIDQYIVGTGGASKDAQIQIPEGLITANEEGITYTINESIEENGFLKCAINEADDFTFEFMSVRPTSVFSFGGKNKRTKRRISRKNRKTRRQTKNKTRRQTKNKTKNTTKNKKLI
jgi:hypothetical protein